MNCALCNKKKFPVVIESHHPIEEQPVIICYICFRSAALEAFCEAKDAYECIEDYKRERKTLQPNRCE